MEPLKYDAVDVDLELKLAVEFFKEHDNRFGYNESDEFGFDGYNRIFYSTMNMVPALSTLSLDKILKLATVIEENAELFAQIEFATRNIPKKHIKKVEIPLLVGYLRVLASNIEHNEVYIKPDTTDKYTEMSGDTPLSNFANFIKCCIFGPKSFLNISEFEIVCTTKMAASSVLFGKLFSEAGLEKPRIRFEKEIGSKEEISKQYCYGVVTGCSDLDSAVDVLLGSSLQAPWKLTCILVEESVYDCFKRSLSWKCREEQDSTSGAEKYCADAYKFRQTLLLCDYAGDRNIEGEIIYIEAYRTTKELINLIAKSKPDSLSLWCNDISEANEIAYNEQAPSIVWINDYAEFGPPQVSLPFYKNLWEKTYTYYYSKENQSTINAWQKLSPADRRKKVTVVIDENLKNMDSVTKPALISAITQLDTDPLNSVTVNIGNICVCRSICRNSYVDELTTQSLSFLFKLLIAGKVLLYGDIDELLRPLFVDLPVINASSSKKPRDLAMSVFKNPFCIKAVLSNHGTIFAN